LGDSGMPFFETRTDFLDEIIAYCLDKKLSDALCYLYNEWYNLKNSKIWMRSARPGVLCRYRTSMFAESHFRILKRDYFSMFGRPVIYSEITIDYQIVSSYNLQMASTVFYYQIQTNRKKN
jgi:hypothetical protein